MTRCMYIIDSNNMDILGCWQCNICSATRCWLANSRALGVVRDGVDTLPALAPWSGKQKGLLGRDLPVMKGNVPTMSSKQPKVMPSKQAPPGAGVGPSPQKGPCPVKT